jgi:myo-inositol-1(or 4)-monophosphatase
MQSGELERLCLACKDIVTDVAAYIGAEFANFDRESVRFKGAHNLVTHVDLEAEKRLSTALSYLVPDAGFITEEETEDRHGSGYRWVIDPVDGTTNFAHGIPCFAVSVALIDPDDLPVIGIVHDVARDEQFVSWKGGGGWLRDKPLKVSAQGSLDHALLATGFPYEARGRVNEFIETFKQLLLRCRALRRLGSAAIDLAYVAAGRFDGFYEHELNAWDVAAGALLIEEAGGTVTDFAGGRNFLFDRTILATNAKLHEEMGTVIRQYFRR